MIYRKVGKQPQYEKKYATHLYLPKNSNLLDCYCSFIFGSHVGKYVWLNSLNKKKRERISLSLKIKSLINPTQLKSMIQLTLDTKT